MRPSPTSLAVIIATLVLAGTVAGCGGSDDDASPASTGSSTSTTEPALTDTTTAATDPPTTEAPVETAPPATEPPATSAPAVDGACLIGDWVVTEEQMDAYYAGLMSTLDAPLTIDTEGSAPLTFTADGTYGWAPTFVLVVEVGGQAGTGDVRGTITGDWIARDGIVTTSSDANALSVSIDVNGITFDGADLANGMLNSSPINGVTYSCDGPTPVIDFQTADPAVTVPVTLTPA